MNQIATSLPLGGDCFYTNERRRERDGALYCPSEKPASPYLVRQLLQGFVYHDLFSLRVKMLRSAQASILR